MKIEEGDREAISNPHLSTEIKRNVFLGGGLVGAVNQLALGERHKGDGECQEAPACGKMVAAANFQAKCSYTGCTLASLS